uniref:Uncharacterized protein n=1 Tax=Prolemur simus TaxID=1328070 RepID=A0A8C8YRN1_PROSS
MTAQLFFGKGTQLIVEPSKLCVLL